jgi:hypothetical protein
MELQVYVIIQCRRMQPDLTHTSQSHTPMHAHLHELVH